MIRVARQSKLPWQRGLFRSQKVFLLICIIIFLLFAVVWTMRSPEAELVALPTVVPSMDTVDVYVPRQVVKAGMKISDHDLRLQKFPRHLIIDELFQFRSASDYYALVSLPAGLPIYLKNLTATPDISGNPVLSKIPDGMRAMAVRVDATSAVEGWAGSGSIVDVILVEKDHTMLIAENVKILSAERSTSPVETSTQPTVPSTVTILVTQEQCLAINTAIPRGKIALVLKASNDKTIWPQKQMQADQLLPEKKVKTSLISGAIKADGVNYALVDGRWIKSSVTPTGFFVSSNKDANAQ